MAPLARGDRVGPAPALGAFHRRRRLHAQPVRTGGARHRGHQHPRRAGRPDRRARVRDAARAGAPPAAGVRAAAHGDLGAERVPGRSAAGEAAWPPARHHRAGRHWSGRGAARRGVRHARHRPAAPPGAGRTGGRDRVGPRADRRPAGRERRRGTGGAAHRRHRDAARRPPAGAAAAGRPPREHRAGRCSTKRRSSRRWHPARSAAPRSTCSASSRCRPTRRCGARPT